MSGDVLQDIPEEDIPMVLEMLRKCEDWPKNFVLHQLISVMEVYKKSNSKFKHKLYLHRDVEKGVFLNRISINLPDREENIFYVYTADPDLAALRHALLETGVIPWRMAGLQFVMVDKRYFPVVQEVFGAKGVQFEPVPNHMLWLPPMVDRPLSPLPADVYLGFLSESHVTEVDNNWPHKFPGSDILVEEHVQKNFGLGLFRKSDNRMVSSALSNFSGGICLLYSDPEFRGKGYAGIIVEQMVKEIRKRGWIPYCTVVIGNAPPEKLFKKYGFEKFTDSTWMIAKMKTS